MNAPSKKHPQFILAVMNRRLLQTGFMQGMNVFDDPDAWFRMSQSDLVFRERAYLDDPVILDTEYRQILPYVIIRLHDPDGYTVRYVTYRRTKLVGEARLAGNASIGFGGHIDMADVVIENSVPQLKETVIQCAQRELVEEVEISLAGIPYSVDEVCNLPLTEVGKRFIYDSTNDVGKVHLGLVVILDLHGSDLEFQCKEEELEMITPMTAKELLTSDLPLENWSRIYLESQLSFELTQEKMQAAAGQ